MVNPDEPLKVDPDYARQTQEVWYHAWWCPGTSYYHFGSRHGMYRQVSNIRRTLVGNKIVDNSDVVGAAPTGDAPTTSELST